MTYATVRQALVTYFAAQSITGLQHIYRDMPWYTEAAQWNITPGRTWAAIAFIHLDDSDESRITTTARTPTQPSNAVGFKQVHYRISVGLQFQYMIPTELQGTDDADAWTDALDSLIDGIKTAIHADPNLGTPGVIFQAGQSNNDMRVQSDLPVYDAPNSRIYSFHRVSFDLSEIINA